MGLLDRYKYKRYMKREERDAEEMSQAQKDARKYQELAKAEQARAQYEKARTSTYKAQVQRKGVGGDRLTGFVKGASGAFGGALNALIGDVNFGQQPVRNKKKSVKTVKKRHRKPKKHKKRGSTEALGYDYGF